MERASSRRQFLTAVAAGAAGLAGCGGTTAPANRDPADGTGEPGRDDTVGGTATRGDPTGGIPSTVGLETLVGGLRAPLDVAFVPGADRRYVAEQQGVVHVHESGGLRGEPLLDLRERVTAGGEKGLLGIALHPAFPDDRRLFVRYSAPRRAGTPDNYSHTFVLAEFEVAADGRRVTRGSERTLLEIPEPQANHNAGDLAFGPEGYLYVAVGDGGAGGDRGTGHVGDWYGAVDGGNGQDVSENLLGSVLRIDVDDRGGAPYAVPPDNPLVGREGLDEHYAWGLRNPWRMAFDRGDLFVGDVGQNSYEEVDLVEKGGNYGWNVREGRHCFGADSCPDRTPANVRGGERLREPVVEYPRSGPPVSGISVIGGQVYRGSALPGLGGRYVFGDLQAGGRLFVATREGDRQWPTRAVGIAGDGAATLDRILSFGRDADGEVYVLGIGDGGGGLHRLAPAG